MLYTSSFESGFPRIYVLDVASVGRRQLSTAQGDDERFRPGFHGTGVKWSIVLTNGGNTDLYRHRSDDRGAYPADDHPVH